MVSYINFFGSAFLCELNNFFLLFAVSQICNEDGMEFTLKLPEGYYGRIYTYGYYDRCFFRGNGGTVNVLRISGAGGFPECGTQRVRERCLA